MNKEAMNRIKCISIERPDLGLRIKDSFLRVGAFYDVVNERIPGPVSNIHDWIEIRNSITGETFERPRYMFGPVLSNNTTYSD